MKSTKTEQLFWIKTAGLVKQPMLLMVMLLGLTFCVALAALLTVADNLNDQADQQSRKMLAKAMENRQEVIRSHLTDYANWGEAYDNLHRTLNVSWAWNNQNLGSSIFRDLKYEGVFIVSPDNKTIYSVLEGQYRYEDFEKWLGTNILNSLITQLEQEKGKPVTRLVVSGDKLTLFGASRITPGGDKSVEVMPGPASLMIFADRLTNQKLREMGDNYGVLGAHFVNPSSSETFTRENSLALQGTEGSIILKWRSADPGGTLLKWLLPLFILLMLGTMLTAFILMQKAIRKARLNDESNFLLEQSRQALSASEHRFRDVAETVTDWIWEADNQLRFTWISERFPVITGYRIHDWLGRPVSEFFPENENIVLQLRNLQTGGTHLALSECRYISAQQQQRYCNIVIKCVPLSEGKSGFRGTATDITLEVEAKERVRYLTHFDDLTGLPNRVQMKEFLEGKLNTPLSQENSLVVIMVDLDKFKPVNDYFGHAAGDKVLYEVSTRLQDCLKGTGLAARLGGDEFIIILPDISSREDVDNLCHQIIIALSQPFTGFGSNIYIGASLGIAMAPQDAENASDLLRFSDIALYKAKNDGRNKWVFYHQDMGENIIQRRELEQDLREGIRDGQLRLVYQPRYDVNTSRINAVEALVRWQHPRHGLLMPDQFITLAEETGLIFALSEWVLFNACSDVCRGLPNLSVSINITPAELQDKGLYGRIKSVLEKTGMEGNRLEIEVTENATLQDQQTTLMIMHQIKALGVRFLIDDFGTGYASLSYLRTFPFDGIKLDRSFISRTVESPEARNIVENMIGLGKAYSLSVTAEGVETQAQLEQLQLLECDSLQGYHIGRPMSIELVRNLTNLHRPVQRNL